jgi:hypothetical protein
VPPETISGLLMSLLFWFSLLLATVLFGVVGLSPKLLEHARLQGQFQINQFQLVQAERQNERLQRVVDAIRNDKDFAAEMTRVEFDAVRPDEEIIPVDSELRLVSRDLAPSRVQPVAPQPWYRPMIVPFVENDSLRMSLLATAAALVIVSFTWFQPATRQRMPRSVVARRSLWQIVRARYVRPT